MYVHLYQKVDRLWTVGYYDPKGAWHAIRDCGSESDAMKVIHYLNGGKNDPLPDEASADDSGVDLNFVPGLSRTRCPFCGGYCAAGRETCDHPDCIRAKKKSAGPAA